MITEDYVSFEIAKLLKSKKFHVPTRSHYDGRGGFGFLDICEIDWNNYKCFRERRCYSAPTLQTAIKWLREVHKISIEISSTGYLIDNDVEWKCDIKAGHRLYFKHITNEKSFESCAEAAIKYSLENLI